MNSLEYVLRSRVAGEHQSKFAMTRVDNIIESSKSGQKTIEAYTSRFSANQNFATEGSERKYMIENGIKYSHAAGAIPLICWKNGEVDILTVYRDKDAPSWPDTQNGASGISHLVNGYKEKMADTMRREPDEEIVFVDSNRSELKPAYKEIFDLRILVKEIFEGKEIDSCGCWVVDPCSSIEDPALVLNSLRVYYPDFSKKEAYVVNGEVIGEKISKRDLYMWNLNEVFLWKKMKPTVYSIDIENDSISQRTESVEAEKIKFVRQPSDAIGKIRGVGKKEFLKLIGV